MSDWQPIETAPKDGTAILVWCPGTVDSVHVSKLMVAVWDPDEWNADDVRGAFRYNRYDSGVYGVLDWDDEPTHWMPLPKPPVDIR